jgi:saccharopine dehydrogenase-like NADP-dependent oxidoreductase
LPGGVRMIDLGPFHADTMRLFALHDLAVASKSQLVTGCGVAPGLTNLVAALGVRDFDTVKGLTINSYLVGDTFLLPSAGTDRLHETKQQTVIVRNGKPHECSEADLATLTEKVDFGGYGTVAVHPISHAEPAVLAASLGIADVTFRTAHPSSEDVVASFLRDNGFLDRAPVAIGTATLDMLTLSTQLFQTAGLPALNAKMIRIDGVRDGRAANAEWFISASRQGTSATAYASGVVAAAVAVELAARPMRYGVFSPEQVLDPGRLIERVCRQGISVVGPTRPAASIRPDTTRSVDRGPSNNRTTTEKESRRSQ